MTLDQPIHILVQVVLGLFSPTLGRFGLLRQIFDERGRPDLELRLILAWDAENPANHFYRQLVVEALDEVDPALVLQLIEQRGDDASDLGTQLFEVRWALGRTKVAHRRAGAGDRAPGDPG